MDEGKKLQEAVDAICSDALDEAMSKAFGLDLGESEPPSDESSKLVGRYKLLEQIGEGGFGVVYMAEQQEPIRRRVALKIIKLGMDTRQVIARFEAERQALAMMDHENIAAVLDAGATETGRPYFVMELVRGAPITQYCDRNKLSASERLKLFLTVCKAIQHAHQKGIIHRDLKPHNVLVTRRDDAAVPKVIDFGVAKATHMRLTEKTVFTRYGQFIGTPAYMSPEQVEMSEDEVDTRSDIYSLGVLLYELLTGSTPIEDSQLKSAGYVEMQRMICEQEPPKPSSRLNHSRESLASICAYRATDPKKLGQFVRGDLDWIVMKALEKDRSRRYETVNGLAADIGRYLNDEPVAAGPPSAAYRLRKFARRRKKLLGAAFAFVSLLVLAMVFCVWLAIRASNAEIATQQKHDSLLEEQRRRQVERVDALLTAVPQSVPLLVDELRASRNEVLPLIRSRFEQASRIDDRLRLAIAQTMLEDPKLDLLAASVPNSHPNECANLVKAFRAHRERAVRLLQQRLASANNEQSRFRFAVLLLELGEPDAAEQLLSWKYDPSIRTRFIHDFRQWHGDLVDVAPVFRRRAALQSGLALALGRLDSTNVSPMARQAIQDALLEVYLNAEEGAAHSASGWALRRWSVSLPPIEAGAPRPKQRWFINGAGQTMIVLGSEATAVTSENAVQFPWSFAIADRETTAALFQRFLDDTAYPADWKALNWPGVDREIIPSDDCPVNRLSLTDIMLFCNWLSRLEDRQVCYERDEDGQWWCRYDRSGYRLPTFEEWDHACYAGATCRFPFGDDEFLLPEYGNLLLRRAQPGAQLMPNNHGVFDMLGNVWDLTHTTRILDVVEYPRQMSNRESVTIKGATFGTGSYYLGRKGVYGSGEERSSDGGFRVLCRIFPPTSDETPLSAEKVIPWLDYQLTVDPGDVELRMQRAMLHVKRRQWSEAAVDFRIIVRMSPDSDFHWLDTAELLAQVEDTDAYRQHCQLMLERFGDVDDPLVTERICKGCLLLPGAIDETAALFQLADKAISADSPPWAAPFTHATKGLADFRAGRFDDAIERLEKNREMITAAHPFLMEFNLAVLAMAYNANDQQETAQELLGKVAEVFDVADGDLSDEQLAVWRDLLAAQILYREAMAMIENP